MKVSPISTERYRQSTDKQIYLIHRPKHCACGKVVSAKQLTQYGACDACYKSDKDARI